MLSWVSLVALIASFICIISIEWSFSGSEGRKSSCGNLGVSLCIFEILIPNLALEITRFPHQHAAIAAAFCSYVRAWMKQAKHSS